ncbi:MAG TPA: MBL fold metallo-hydrolase RNA specificity domain-containing protein [Candidatus Acidoferrales bacterium]|nr:MBL fold metallo-hydrolase RNA specificity domain-containing protein [Candidatus Acidoferrales bacterium]
MKISFFGAAEEVGRSCIMVSSGKTKILLDAGVKLGEHEEHPLFDDKILNEIDAIFVSHAHLDHSGFLPHIFSAGYKGKVYATKPTIELINVLLTDYMRLSEPKDVTKEGFARLQKSYTIVEFGERVTIKDLTMSFSFSGHIIGSGMITVSDEKQTLLYTGDVNLSKTRLLEGADLKGLKATTIITESTYSGRKDIFPPEGVVVKKMLKSIKDTLNAGGKVIIPSFAVGRAQEVLLLLDDYMSSGAIPKVPIYVDGMINKALRIHRHNVIYCRKELQSRILMSDFDPFKSDNFFPVEKKGVREKIVSEDQSSIIVTTSGMLTGGPIMFYLTKMSGNSMNKMILVGYQASGTLGRQIQEGAKTISVNHKKVDVQMTVEAYHLSAHADRPQLDKMIKSVEGLKNIYIVHGEKTKTEEFKTDLATLKYNAILPRLGGEYDL